MTSIKQAINQSTKQSSKQSLLQLYLTTFLFNLHQSNIQLISQSITPSIDRSINQSINQSACKSLKYSQQTDLYTTQVYVVATDFFSTMNSIPVTFCLAYVIRDAGYMLSNCIGLDYSPTTVEYHLTTTCW